MKTCNADGCNKPVSYNNLCNKHAERMRRNGTLIKKNHVPTRFKQNHYIDGGTDCWIWTGTKMSTGYGTISVNNKKKLAHRLSWELHNGVIPDGLHVLHKCDTPSCVNPSHLFLGTDRDNAYDAIAKGRMRAGGILTVADVKEIRKLNKNGMSYSALARKYNRGRTVITKMCKRETWKDA